MAEEVVITRTTSWNVEEGRVFPVVTVRIRQDSTREELTGYWRASEAEALERYLQAREDDDRDVSGYRIRPAVLEVSDA